MRGTFFGIEIGRTGLSTAQFGLDTTGHNIANVDTAGYTRQRIVSSAYDPFNSIGRFAPVPGHALVGGGVRIQVLDQIRSAYLDRRFRTESTEYAYWETRTQSLSYIESFFDQVNEEISINSSMAQFFGAMSLLARDPLSGASRTMLQTTAMDLVQQLNMIYSGMIDLQRSENRAVQTKTDDINEIANAIAELNKQIYAFEVTGMIANDLRDKRNLLVDRLSEYIDIEYEEYPDPVDLRKQSSISDCNKMFKVTIDGVTLVDHDMVSELDVRLIDNPIKGEEQVYEVYWKDIVDGSGFTGRALNWNNIQGGSIKAHIDVRDGNEYKMVWDDTAWDYVPQKTTDSRYKGIPYYVEMVNDLARALVQMVNEQHRLGWTDHPLISETGVNFFDDRTAFTITGPGIGGDPAEFRFNKETGQWNEWDPVRGTWADPGGIILAGDTYGDFTDFYGNPLPATYTVTYDISNITAKNFDLDQKIKESAWNIACSNTQIDRAAAAGTEYAERHNNENMKALYLLFSRSDITVTRTDGNGVMTTYDIGSFDDYGTVIRFSLGKTLYTAKQTGETSRILKLAAENQKTSIAGVSLDEEMVGLVRYQHAYNGAARVITAMDDALDRLINGTGRVGL